MIKSIETVYNGVTFRSRLEARFAVFLDCVRIRWRYEYEGFELPSGRYLPDFWLPDVDGGAWFEIKGQHPTEHEQRLCAELSTETGHNVTILVGDWEAYLFFSCSPAAEGCPALRGLAETYAQRLKAEGATSIDIHAFGDAMDAARKHRFWDPS